MKKAHAAILPATSKPSCHCPTGASPLRSPLETYISRRPGARCHILPERIRLGDQEVGWPLRLLAGPDRPQGGDGNRRRHPETPGIGALRLYSGLRLHRRGQVHRPGPQGHSRQPGTDRPAQSGDTGRGVAGLLQGHGEQYLRRPRARSYVNVRPGATNHSPSPLIMSTGIVDCKTTFSATLPSRSFSIPVLPLLAITIRSASISRADLRISWLGFP